MVDISNSFQKYVFSLNQASGNYFVFPLFFFFFFITDKYFKQSFLFDFVLSAILLDMGNIKQVTANI